MTLTAEAAHAAYERAVALRVHLAREALAAGRNTRRLAEEHDTPALQEQVHAAAMARALGLRPVPGVASSALAAMQYVDRTRKRDRSGAPTAHTTAAALLDRGVNTINRIHAQLNTYRQEAVQRMITQRIVRSCVHHLIGETWDTHRAHYLQAFRWLRGAKPWTAVQVGRRMGKSMAVAQTFIAIALQCPGIQIGVLGNSHRVTMLMLVYLARLYNEYVARDDAQFPVDADGNVMRPIGFNHVKTSHIEIVFPDGRRSKVSAFPASPNLLLFYLRAIDVVPAVVLVLPVSAVHLVVFMFLLLSLCLKLRETGAGQTRNAADVRRVAAAIVCYAVLPFATITAVCVVAIAYLVGGLAPGSMWLLPCSGALAVLAVGGAVAFYVRGGRTAQRGDGDV